MTALLDPTTAGAPEPDPRPSTLSDRVRGQLATPLVRAGLSLVASAGITSLLGLLYWSLAARRYSPAAIGATAALLAAMEIVAAVANLGLRTALIRFVPALGDRAARVVAVSYGVAGLTALLGAGVFVVVHERWFDELDLLDHTAGVTFFLLSCVLWVIFSLQDSVLIGLRRATWVPTENALYALAKLALLVGLTSTLPRWGVYVSWTAPLVLMVLAVNIPVFRMLRAPRPAPAEDLTIRDLLRFSAGDYLASALWLLTIDALPLLMLVLVGAEGGAWYHLAWTVAYTLYLVSSAVGYALLAEGAHEPAALEANARRALGQSLALVVPAATVIVVGAPWILRLFGADYATEGTQLLQLLAASAIPHAVTGVYVSIERARRDMRAIITLYAVLGVAVVAGTALLVPLLGVTGAGVAWLATQSGVALFLLATHLRDLWIGALPTRLIRTLGAPGRRRTEARQHRLARRAIAALDDHALPDLGDWTVLHATADLVVARVGVPEELRILKLPSSDEAEAARRKELVAVRVLAQEAVLADWRVQVPRPIAHGTDGTQAWTLETAVPGHPAEEVLGNGLAPDRFLRSASAALAGLHGPTAQTVVAPDALLANWIDEPVTVVARACPEALPGLAELAAALHLALADRPLTVAWSHGDITPGNLLVTGDAVTGMVDWEGARGDRLPELDLATLVITTRAAVQTLEFGETVLALLHRPWTEEELAVLGSGPNRDLDSSTLVLLAWLHHIAANLAKSSAYATNRVWLVRNVLSVAATLAPAATTPPTPAPVPERTAVREPEVTPSVVAATVTPPLPTTSAPRWRAGVPYAVPILALLGWTAGLAGADPRDLSDYGLVSIVGPVGFAALGLLLAGFAVAIVRPRLREGLVAAHVATLAVILFGTPVVLYDAVRYSWAWKHIGIVDFIDRTGGVDPNIDVLPVYHNWPGFFAGSHLLQEWVGADNAIAIARWAPLVLALATAAAVFTLAASLTTDRRIIWLTTWVFLLGNWVGQEYFSPQAYAYLLYLASITLVLRMAKARRPGAAGIAAVVLMAMAIATSHQITPAMLTIALVALVVTRQARIATIAVVAAVATVLWALWGAAAYVGPNLADAIDGFGAPLANAEGNLTDAGPLSDGQALVSLAGRLLVVAIALLAAVGLIRRWWRGQRDLAPIVLLVSPAVVLAANNFGGEILFRVFLFSLPFAAFFAAHALVDLPLLRGRLGALVPFVVSLALLAGFLLAHFGKDGHYVFTPEEVAAATWLADNAPEGSLLVEGSRNYPTQFHNYEYFRYVPIDREPLATRREIARRPVRTLERWMTDERDTAAYVLLTRSQQREETAMGFRPAGFLAGLEEDLRASDRFAVAFENRDAVIFTLRGAQR